MSTKFLRSSAAALALFAGGAAFAQQAQAPAAGAAPQQQQQQQPQGPVKANLVPVQPEWTKVCGGDPQSQKEVCYTTRDFGLQADQPILALAVYDPKGAPEKVIRLLLPPGLLLKPGFRFSIDKGPQETGAFEICFPNGCFAEAKVKPATVDSMKKAEKMAVVVKNQVNNEVTFVLPLANFGKAFDGAAIDPKVLEERQKKLQEDMEKKAAEERGKLDASKGGAAARRSGRQGSRRQVIDRRVDAAANENARVIRGRFFMDGTSWRRRGKLVAVVRPHAINAVVRPNESLVDLRMAHRVARSVGDEVLFRDIGDIFGFGVFGEEMVERLILARPNLFRDRQPPFLRVGKHRVDVVDHTAKWIAAVPDDLTDRELC